MTSPSSPPRYDRLPALRLEFVPLWGSKVFLVYAPRRVDCPTRGVRVERLPWAAGKHCLTQIYAWFLARWAKCLSWQEVAEAFRTSWDTVFRSVEMAVTWGCAHRDLSGISTMGTVEVAWQKGHKYLTLGALSSSVVEGFNGKAKLISKRVYGFRTFRAQEIALYHALGTLPEPTLAHRLC